MPCAHNLSAFGITCDLILPVARSASASSPFPRLAGNGEGFTRKNNDGSQDLGQNVTTPLPQ